MLRRNRRNARRRGFTLMEMLVVLAILVLLVAMVAPRLLGTQKKANISAAKTQIGLLKGALERYALDMNGFPTTEQGLSALVQAPTADGISGGVVDGGDAGMGMESEGTTGSSSSWAGPYVNSNELPKDPWGRQYQYEYPPTHGSGEYPDIWSYGPDGEDATDDDIVSWNQSQEGGEMGGGGEDMPAPVEDAR
ncbi:MAG: prepilin-type N-terminal cleavage/methylation domain-containing protein [Rhodopirellula sp.]|nr:prepilin-type N-terminal cleavage/methylation domain-containing protein [Rhodopirellula sp.]